MIVIVDVILATLVSFNQAYQFLLFPVEQELNVAISNQTYENLHGSYFTSNNINQNHKNIQLAVNISKYCII